MASIIDCSAVPSTPDGLFLLRLGTAKETFEWRPELIVPYFPTSVGMTQGASREWAALGRRLKAQRLWSANMLDFILADEKRIAALRQARGLTLIFAATEYAQIWYPTSLFKKVARPRVVFRALKVASDGTGVEEIKARTSYFIHGRDVFAVHPIGTPLRSP